MMTALLRRRVQLEQRNFNDLRVPFGYGGLEAAAGGRVRVVRDLHGFVDDYGFAGVVGVGHLLGDVVGPLVSASAFSYYLNVKVDLAGGIGILSEGVEYGVEDALVRVHHGGNVHGAGAGDVSAVPEVASQGLVRYVDLGAGYVLAAGDGGYLEGEGLQQGGELGAYIDAAVLGAFVGHHQALHATHQQVVGFVDYLVFGGLFGVVGLGLGHFHAGALGAGEGVGAGAGLGTGQLRGFVAQVVDDDVVGAAGHVDEAAIGTNEVFGHQFMGDGIVEAGAQPLGFLAFHFLLEGGVGVQIQVGTYADVHLEVNLEVHVEVAFRFMQRDALAGRDKEEKG